MERGRGHRRTSALVKRVGERLRELRLERGLSPAKVAKLAGTSAAAVRLVEDAKRRPSIVTLELLATALGATLQEIIGGPARASEKLPPANERIVLRLVEGLRARPLRELEAVEDLLRAFDKATKGSRRPG